MIYLTQNLVHTFKPNKHVFYSYPTIMFSNFYLLIGWKIKSYLANSEKFWPFGLYEGHKAKKGQKKILANESE